MHLGDTGLAAGNAVAACRAGMADGFVDTCMVDTLVVGAADTLAGTADTFVGTADTFVGVDDTVRALPT